MGWFSKNKEVNNYPLDGARRAQKNSYLPFESIQGVVYDGEITPNELGIPKDYIPDYQMLAARSWQSYHESDMLYSLVNRLAEWVIGRGITLVSEPKEKLLKALGVDIDSEELQGFSQLFEDLFEVIKNSKESTKDMKFNLNQLSVSAYITALLSGDVLAIYRYNDNRVYTEFVDGRFVLNPTKAEVLEKIKAKGNTIVNGVEFDKSGKTVAFHVLSKSKENCETTSFQWSGYDTTRIEAYGKNTGRTLAKLIFGNVNYRVDAVRGMPLFSVILEVSNQITRYRNSALAKAEEIANTAMVTEHKDYSSGEDPREAEILDEAGGLGIEIAQETAGYGGYAVPDTYAKKVAMTTKRKVYNLPVGASMKAVESTANLDFPDFFKVNFGSVCAAVSIPPEVALLAFNSNYTAAQLAASFFRHKINLFVKLFADQAYTPFLELILEVYHTKGDLRFPLYEQCRRNWLLSNSLLNKSWSSDPIPKADPLKEAKTSRVLLGAGADNIPLTSMERESLANNIGDWNGNIETYIRDFNYAEKLGVTVREEEEEESNNEDN